MKSERLALYLKILKKLAYDFENFSLTQVPKEEKTEEYALANLGSSLRIQPEMKIHLTDIITPSIEALSEKPNNPEQLISVASIGYPDQITPQRDPDK